MATRRRYTEWCYVTAGRAGTRTSGRGQSVGQSVGHDMMVRAAGSTAMGSPNNVKQLDMTSGPLFHWPLATADGSLSVEKSTGMCLVAHGA